MSIKHDIAAICMFIATALAWISLYLAWYCQSNVIEFPTGVALNWPGISIILSGGVFLLAIILSE